MKVYTDEEWNEHLLHRRNQSIKWNKISTSRKTECIYHYSNGMMKCACCSSDNNLQLDHINGGGQVERMKLTGGIGGERFYRILIKLGFPEGYQVLCCDCNFVKSIYNKCPCNGRGFNVNMIIDEKWKLYVIKRNKKKVYSKVN